MNTIQNSVKSAFVITCRLCCRNLSSPWRVYDERGHVMQGCVSPDHTGHLVPLSESLRWHNRPEAKKLRKELNWEKGQS